MNLSYRFSIALLLSTISLIGGENLIPSGGNPADFFLVQSEGKGEGELNISSGSEGGTLIYTGRRGNITLARFAPGGKSVETLANRVSLTFQIDGTGSLGLFVRSTEESAYLVLLNRSAEGQGSFRLFKRPASSQAGFTSGVLASQTFEWPQVGDWCHLALELANQPDDSVVIQAAITDATKSLVTEINKSDVKAPLLNPGSIALRFYASETRPATIKVREFSFLPPAQ